MFELQRPVHTILLHNSIAHHCQQRLRHMLAFHILWRRAAGIRVVPWAGLHHPIPHQHCWFHTCFVCRHSIYYGDAQLATEWFHKLGYTIPYLINAADFILDLASGDVSTKKISGADSRLHLINCAERFLTVSAAASNCSGSCTLAHHLHWSQSLAVGCCSVALRCTSTLH